MAYNTRWEPHKAAQCIAEAEKKALYPGEAWGNGFLYRFEDQSSAGCVDPDGDIWSFYEVVELVAYNVLNWTPCGATLYEYSGARKRFVNLQATKKFACKTVEEAKESFKARKTKQALIYRARADKADRAIAMLEGVPFDVPQI